MLLKLAIWMIIFKTYAFNVPKKSDFRTQEVNKIGHLSILWWKSSNFIMYVVLGT